MDNNFSLNVKDNITNLVKCLENTNTTVNELQILDTSFEEWTELLSKSSKILGCIYKTYNFSQLLIFKKFIKGLASQINSENPIDSQSKEKLYDYLSKEQNIEFIYTTVRKSLTANSLKCTQLLAIIVGEILQKQLEMNIENITIIDALHSLNDYDLINFYKIYSTIIESGSKKIRLDKLYTILPKNSIQISINKLVNLQIFLQDTITIHQGFRFGGDEDDPLNTIMNDDEKFLSIYEISDKLFDLVEKTKGEILFLG